MLRLGLALLAVACTKQLPSRDDRCRDAADHLAKVSTATMGASDRRRVLASCMTWPDAALDCLLAATDDAGIDRCQASLR